MYTYIYIFIHYIYTLYIVIHYIHYIIIYVIVNPMQCTNSIIPGWVLLLLADLPPFGAWMSVLFMCVFYSVSWYVPCHCKIYFLLLLRVILARFNFLLFLLKRKKEMYPMSFSKWYEVQI